MSGPENRLLFPYEDQLSLALILSNNGLFGIHEDPQQKITLKSGRESPHYLDMRKGISAFTARQAIAATMAELAERQTWRQNMVEEVAENYDHIAGTPEAMTSYAASIADILRMSLLQPRVASGKTTGNKAPILGQYRHGDTVAAFDDVVTDGQSKVDTFDSFAAAGLDVKDYFVVVDREEGGSPHVLEAVGLRITPALGVSSLVRVLRGAGQISQRQYDNVRRYMEQYGEPHAQEALNQPL